MHAAARNCSRQWCLSVSGGIRVALGRVYESGGSLPSRLTLRAPSRLKQVRHAVVYIIVRSASGDRKRVGPTR